MKIIVLLGVYVSLHAVTRSLAVGVGSEMPDVGRGMFQNSTRSEEAWASAVVATAFLSVRPLE